MSERIRCAIYTRKSTEEGLEQDFNSLDAQREACEAYIQSQKGLGWTIVAKRYDDGGLSGGNLERPALQELLADIDRGKVDLVVVYKVDRLTRSLMDFAKIIETFDAKEVSFVSVTQQFNTSNSMGRLTLNVLLSFAQFEREVTAERIRDKIAASKRKGMWMGGLAPLGYDALEKKLVINQAEAETVRELFQLYQERGSIRGLKQEADQREIRTKVRIIDGEKKGGRPFTRGHLQQLLRNPIYIGKTVHKGEAFEGEHEAIIDLETWDAVQEMLAGKAPARATNTNQRSGSLLAGLLFDETGDRLTPSHAKKGNKAYRYYVSSRLVTNGKDDESGWRLPQAELDSAVVHVLTDYLGDEREWASTIDLADVSPAEIDRARARVKELLDQLSGPAFTRQQAVKDLTERVVVAPGELSVLIKTNAPTLSEAGSGPVHLIEVPIDFRRRGIETKVIFGGADGRSSEPDPKLTKLIAEVRTWIGRINSGEVTEVRQLAAEAGIDLGDVSRFLPLAFLAPDIVEDIVQGRQPSDLTAETLKRINGLAIDWPGQRRVLGLVDDDVTKRCSDA